MIRESLIIAKTEHKSAWLDMRFVLGIILTVSTLFIVMYLMSGVPKFIFMAMLKVNDELTWFFKLFTWVMAMVIANVTLLVAYDAIAQDRQAGTLRYFYSKVPRQAVLAGKTLSLLAYLLVVDCAVCLAAYIYLLFKGFNPGLSMVCIMLFLLAYGLVWLSVTVSASSLSLKPAYALLFAWIIMPCLYALHFTALESLSPFSYIPSTFGPATILLQAFYLVCFSVAIYGVGAIGVEVMDP